MSLALEVAQLAGVSVAGVSALVAALYGRKALKWAGKLSKWATIGFILLVVLGLGAILGWWDLNPSTMLEHAEIVGGFLGDLASGLVEWAT